MGCWYGSCFMSHLPIMPGDDIAIFLLAPNYPDEKDGLTCYPTDRYVPIGFPIFAEYDDDIRVRKIKEVNEYMYRYLHEFAKVYTKKGSIMVDNEDIPVFEEYVWNNMKDFVCSIIDGEIWVDGQDGNKQRLEHVMMHADLYFNLLENMSERIPYGKDKTNSELMEKSILKTIEWLKEEDEFSSLMRSKYGLNAPGIRRFTDRIHIDSFCRWKSIDKMAQYYIETGNESILDDLLNYILWSQIMNYSRYGYHCVSGGGSQDQEMMLQKVIAEFVLAKCAARELEAAQDGYDGSNGSVLEEDIFFWDKD